MLPDAAENPIIFKFSTDMIPICLLSVEAKESMAGLYKILDDGVANPLARIDGVGTVSISGAPKREIHVYCDPNKLEAYNMSVEQISSIIQAETVIRRADHLISGRILMRCACRVSLKMPGRWRIFR